jgi:DNA-binding XRE family transcriptional regulator
MTEDEIERVINELKELAGEEYGGQSELARKLGVPRQRINDWFTGKRTPELKAWLKIQEFLRDQKRGRPSSRRPGPP